MQLENVTIRRESQGTMDKAAISAVKRPAKDL